MIRRDEANERVREFEQVALVHLDVLYQTALWLTRNRTDAEDVVQETYLRASRGFRRFNPETNCRAWLLTILRHVFLRAPSVLSGRHESGIGRCESCRQGCVHFRG